MKSLKFLFTALLLLCCTVATAHDFEVDGIYYNILSEEEKTVEVTCRGSYYNDYSNEYNGDVTIPEKVTYNSTSYSVTTIGSGAFARCSSLTSIEIPNSVTAIGDDAFNYCNSLTSIEMPNSVTAIGDRAFTACTGLTSIEIPNSVRSIGEKAFTACTGLTSITIPNSVTYIEDYAFMDCYSLTSITIPDSVTTIPWGAFVQCKSLTKVTIPNSVTKIENSAFFHCYSLTSIEIPNSVTFIDHWAFNRCDNLTSVISHIPAEKLFAIDSDVFSSDDKDNCTLYVPAGAKETYAATSGWDEFANIIELPATFDLTVSAAGYATLYLDYNAIIPNGVEVYTANTVKGDRLMLQQVNGVLPANTAAIVRAEQGTYTFTQSDEEVAAIENNLLRGSVEDEYITPKKGFAYYVLSMKNGIVGMYKDELTGGTFKNNANKAYLVLTDITVNDEEVDTQTPGVQLSNSYYFDFSGTTAIDEVVTGVNDNIYYDLSGRRVENPTSGIYILNGNKVLVK